jgi:hypothetical protein
VYFYHSETVPLFALNVFAKNEKANLTKEERNGSLTPPHGPISK